MDCSPEEKQAPLLMGCSRQEYWSWLPCPSSGYLPKPGIELVSLLPPALAGNFLTTGTTLEARMKWQMMSYKEKSGFSMSVSTPCNQWNVLRQCCPSSWVSMSPFIHSFIFSIYWAPIMCQNHANHRAELVNVAYGINLVFGTMVLFWSNVPNLCKGSWSAFNSRPNRSI